MATQANSVPHPTLVKVCKEIASTSIPNTGLLLGRPVHVRVLSACSKSPPFHTVVDRPADQQKVSYVQHIEGSLLVDTTHKGIHNRWQCVSPLCWHVLVSSNTLQPRDPPVCDSQTRRGALCS